MKLCVSCGKGSLVGGRYSNRVRATKFNPTGKVRRQPNLQWGRDSNGARVRLCAKCLKTANRPRR